MRAPANDTLLDNALHPKTPTDPWRNAILLAIAAAGLGSAIQVRDGLYDPHGFVGLTLALFAALAIYWPAAWPLVDKLRAGSTRVLFAGALAFNFIQWFAPGRLPGSWHGPTSTWHSTTCLALAAIVCAAMVVKPELSRLLLLVLVALFCALGAWMIHKVPRPFMDVWMLQTEGLKSFAAGHNPFSTPFADIYHRPGLYAPGALHADGLVHQGFPYPPMVLWLELPGQLIGNDYRWSNLAAMAISAVLIGFTLPSSRAVETALADEIVRAQESVRPLKWTLPAINIGPLAAALFLFTPRGLFVLESGWTEPITALLLAATIFCAVRLPKLMPIFLGMFLCSKQYLLWAIPPILLLAGQPLNVKKLAKILAIAFATGCAVSLPLILWNPKAYLAANVDVAQGAAFRTDALSYLALFANATGHIPTPGAATLIGFGAATIVTALVCLRGSRTPAGYAAAVATAHLAFFAFYKFAFCNYEWFLIAGFCCAAGALSPAKIVAGQSDLEVATSPADRSSPAADRTARV